MGLRQGLCRSLERKGIDYILWNPTAITSHLKTKSIIIYPFSADEEEFRKTLKRHKVDVQKITHIIAGSEAPVVFASLARKWLKVKRNPHNLIVKCTDKLTMKKFLVEKEIPMGKFEDIRNCSSRDELIESLGFPLVLKARNSSGGRGLEFLNELSDEEFAHLKKNAKKLDIYCEGAIKGREGSIESFIQNHEILFTNITQYYIQGHCNIIPGIYDEKLCSEIRELNQKVVEALNIKWGMTHLEYYLTDKGVLFGEIALRPPGGHIMDCLDLSYNANFWDYFIGVELHEEDITFPEGFDYSSAYIFHPGEGKVESVDGVDELKKLTNLKTWKLKIKKGDSIQARIGVGNDTGYALLKDHSPKNLVKSIDRITSELKISFK